MFSQHSGRITAADFRRGDAVTVRSLDEILATLDADAKLEGLPFMPEMVPLCGRTFRVHRRAEKTCVEGIGIRGMKNTVLLDGLRCDGSAHDGCQRGCLFFWNEAWLKPAEEGQQVVDRGQWTVNREPSCRRPLNGPDPSLAAGLSPLTPAVHPSSFILHPSQLPTTKSDRFFCQSTELANATADYSVGKWQGFIRDFRLGELTLRRFAYVLWRALHNRLWRRLRGHDFYQIVGPQTKTVATELNLQPGELVEIKSFAEIKATLDANGRNRGLSFEPEMALQCGRRYRVATPVRTIILEATGKMAKLSNTVILEGLVCQGICATNCPRANFLYWREIWLKRV
jgi:hypothetical protein